MQRLRIGCVKYLNTLPLVEGLASCADLGVVTAVPARLIDMLLQDQIDVGLVSLIDAARSPEPLSLLPVGMIGCDGPTLTVRLFSAVPLESVREVHVDTDSHTSVCLMRVVLDRLFGIRPTTVDFDARERVALRPAGLSGPHVPSDSEWPESLLLIGDKVVTDSPPAVRYPHQLDLGEAWKQLTGLSFVYATWMCLRRRADEPGIRFAAELLDRQRRHNATRLDWIVDTRSRERAWPEDLARQYVGTLLRYAVGDRERQAVSEFLDHAARLGLIASPRVHWADLHPAVQG